MGPVPRDLPEVQVKTRLFVLVLCAGLAGLWGLRDPAWLGDYTYGLRPETEDGTGRVFRWTSGHASFYVPSSARVAQIDLAGHEWFPVQGAIYVDGRLAQRVRLDDHWQRLSIDTAVAPSTRRHRRIDLRVARTWGPERLGVRLGWPLAHRAAIAGRE
jgi:hypothetical protein